MDKDRFKELQFGPDPQILTKEELEEGYMWCHCEWDGMLMLKTDPEAKFCTCYQKTLLTPPINKELEDEIHNNRR